MYKIKSVYYRSAWESELTTEGRIVLSVLIHHSIYTYARSMGWYSRKNGFMTGEALEVAMENGSIPYEEDVKFLDNLTKQLHITKKTMRSCIRSIEKEFISYDEDGCVLLNIPDGMDLQNYFQLHTDFELKGNDLLLYSWLRYLVDDRGNRTRTINKSIEDLMADLLMTKGTIKDSLTRLKKAGLIERIYIGKSGQVVKSRIKVYESAVDEDKRQMPKKIKKKTVETYEEPKAINVPTPVAMPVTKPKTRQRKEDMNQLSLF